jgi:glycosyltransferase 2 family protein
VHAGDSDDDLPLAGALVIKRFASLAGGLLAVVCLGFFAHAVGKHWQAIRDIPLDATVYGSMAGALVLYCATYVTGAKSWQLILHSLGSRIDYRESLCILTISQFAKYLPGNVGHHFGRVLLARRAGIGTDTAITSVGLDTVLAVSAAALCALGALQMLPEIFGRYGFAVGRNVAIVIATGAIIVGIALAFPAARGHLAGAMRHCRNLVAHGNRARSAKAWVLYLINFALGAAALGCISAALTTEALPGFANVIGIYAVAWLVGFLVPGAPAGLGVREALLVLGLSPLLGQDAATATTALLRVVTVAGDGIAFALGWATAHPHIRRIVTTSAGSERTK